MMKHLLKQLIYSGLFFVFLYACGFSAYEKEIKAFQDEMNAEFADSLTSPLTEEDRKDFHGLDFYPVDEKYRVTASFERLSDTQKVILTTTTDRKPEYIKYAKVSFSLDGKDFELYVFQSVRLKADERYKNYLFLPFKDLTCGKTSYGGGRYVDLEIPRGDSIVIDFNKAYNPYCAYNHRYSCVIPPPENFMDIPVYAGVKAFEH